MYNLIDITRLLLEVFPELIKFSNPAWVKKPQVSLFATKLYYFRWVYWTSQHSFCMNPTYPQLFRFTLGNCSHCTSRKLVTNRIQISCLNASVRNIFTTKSKDRNFDDFTRCHLIMGIGAIGHESQSFGMTST